MRRDLPDLAAFVVVAKLRSFRRAAAELGVTASALSHGLRGLEERLGVQLLQRTTRSVGLTEAGQHLYQRLGPSLDDVAQALEEVNGFRGHPRGRLRINVPKLAARLVVAPRLAVFTAAYPDVDLEVTVNDGFIDIVEQGFDAGIRFGEGVERDMIAVRVSSDQEFAVAGSPEYFARRPRLVTPHDLRQHACLGFRMPTSGVLYRWEFEKDGLTLEVTPRGAPVLNDPDLAIRAAVDGVGLVYTGEAFLAPDLAGGRLVRVLADWCPAVPGFFLYYPNRRHSSAALSALVDALRVR